MRLLARTAHHAREGDAEDYTGRVSGIPAIADPIHAGELALPAGDAADIRQQLHVRGLSLHPCVIGVAELSVTTVDCP